MNLTPGSRLGPFADFGAVYVQASTLARHAGGLIPDARVGVLLHVADSRDAHPMQLPRLSLQAKVRILDLRDARLRRGRRAVQRRFPAAGMTLELGDFNLYELSIERGRYVEGFARAFNVGPHTLQDVAALIRPSAGQ